MNLILVLEQALNGLQLGVMLFLMAAGLTLVFGIMNLVNLAHGSLYMVGAYLATAFYQWTGSFLAAVPLALAGTLIAPAFFANPTFGTDYFILAAFVIVVLGTMGNFVGALIGGLLIGIAEGVGGLVFGPALRQLVSLLVFVVVLLFLPRGLFGGKVT